MSVSFFEVAEQAARTGGEIVSRYFREGTAVRSKESYNLVTDADLESERQVVEVIRRAFPDHAILGEELHEADVSAEHLWIVDPLDGTNNFAHGIPHLAVSIAYYHGGVPQCGVILNPLRDDCYTCRRGEGAWHNGRRVHVSAETQLAQALIGVGFYYDRGRMMEATLAAIGDLFRGKIHGMRRFGTASLDLCQVGVGMFGAYFEFQLAPWDFAAGRLFVEEAGGRVTTCQGASLPLAMTSVLASNGHLHEAVREIVSRHWAH